MAGRPENASKSKPFTVAVSVQSRELLEKIAQRGIYGRSAAEVAGRFIDLALERFTNGPPKFDVTPGGEVKDAT